jgi:hypothetical protein
MSAGGTKGARRSGVPAGPYTAYGAELRMGPQSTPLAIEHTIGGHRYTLWRYGDADLQAPAEVWAIRDDGRRLTIDTARAAVRAGHGERAAGDGTDGWWEAERAALVAAAQAFHATYDKAEHTRRRRRREAPAGAVQPAPPDETARAEARDR